MVCYIVVGQSALNIDSALSDSIIDSPAVCLSIHLTLTVADDTDVCPTLPPRSLLLQPTAVLSAERRISPLVSGLWLAAGGQTQSEWVSKSI